MTEVLTSMSIIRHSHFLLRNISCESQEIETSVNQIIGYNIDRWLRTSSAVRETSWPIIDS